MAQHKNPPTGFGRVLGRILLGVLIVILLGFFILWRVDNVRAERFRASIADRVVTNLSWTLVPITKISAMVRDYQSYEQLYQQNQDLRRELQQMKAWRESALQLEQENARLLDLNKVKVSPKYSYLSGRLITDSGSPFRQSAIINLGRFDGLRDGWAAMDGLGLVGRISGLGNHSARVVFLTDTNSAIPVIIKPSDQRGILTGDNSAYPSLSFIESRGQIKAGDRVFTSGDGQVFPPDLLIGQIIIDKDGVLRADLAADYKRLQFLRIIRYNSVEQITLPNQPIVPAPAFQSGAR